MEDNLITVVVPVFNNQNTIEETIESVLNQTNSNWEVICVDDGSTDNSVSIIKEYCKKDDRISLIIRDIAPKGGSHCRNIGAFNAKGKYVMFLDADDLLAPFCLEKRLSSIKDTNADFVVFP
ncbi:MAG: glycosyltransferase family 2 protein, partial [Bacteroidota bacterium]|nr:glycosyltransferase family 2 protein [Bacteroidota bacterium]